MSDSCHDGVEKAELGNIQLWRSKEETSVDMKDEQNIMRNGTGTEGNKQVLKDSDERENARSTAVLDNVQRVSVLCEVIQEEQRGRWHRK